MENENDLILGLDVSTKTIGIALFEDMGEEGKLRLLHHVSPKPKKPKPESKIEELTRKSKIFEEEFLDKYLNSGISKVIIEEPLINSKNAYTVATLLKFNGMVCKSIYDSMGIVPDFISSYNARANSFPDLLQKSKYKKDGSLRPEKEREKMNPVLFGEYEHGVDKKKVIWEKVNKIQPDVNWLYKKDEISLKKENFDMTDAYVCVVGKMVEEGKWNHL